MCNQIEKGDTVLAAVTVELLQGNNEFVSIVTTDVDTGEDVVAPLEGNGFENRVQVKMDSS